MSNLILAIRNLLRNSRRSATTVLAMVIGLIALLLFGGFISNIYFGLQTGIVRSQGHLHIYPQGYLEYGSSRSTEYYIDNYKALITTLNNDKLLKRRIRVMTPFVRLTGIAGNYTADTSTTFIATGLVPSDYNRMQSWDKHHLDMSPQNLALTDDKIEEAVLGFGMARMLNLCETLKVPDCIDQPTALNDALVDNDIMMLQALTEEDSTERLLQDDVRIDLLGSTGSGAPNAISLSIVKAQQQGNKILDDNYIAMHLRQAQKLIFANESRVSAIIIQLKDTGLMGETQVYLERLLTEIKLTEQKFEVKNYTEFNLEFFQIIRMFYVIFIFVAIVISLVVLFTTINTLTMSVMERIGEIGSLRAMGLRRSAVRWQFMLEGIVIGVVGATLGIFFTVILVQIFNNAGFSWVPPNNASIQPLKILLFANPTLVIGAWSLMVCVATFSSLMPARFASQMNIVDAIRHS